MYSRYANMPLPQIRCLKLRPQTSAHQVAVYHPRACNVCHCHYQCFHPRRTILFFKRPVSSFRLSCPRSPLIYTLFDTMMGPTCKPRFHSSISHSYVTLNYAMLIKGRPCSLTSVSHIIPEQFGNTYIALKVSGTGSPCNRVKITSVRSNHTHRRDEQPSRLPTRTAG